MPAVFARWVGSFSVFSVRVGPGNTVLRVTTVHEAGRER
jgi:hypothetical protein